jgi:hypothetical protein
MRPKRTAVMENCILTEVCVGDKSGMCGMDGIIKIDVQQMFCSESNPHSGKE